MTRTALLEKIARALCARTGSDPDRPTLSITTTQGGKIIDERIEEYAWEKHLADAETALAVIEANPS